MLIGLLGLIGAGATAAAVEYKSPKHYGKHEMVTIKDVREKRVKHQKKLLSLSFENVQKPITWNQRKERKWLRQNPQMRNSKKVR